MISKKINNSEVDKNLYGLVLIMIFFIITAIYPEYGTIKLILYSMFICLFVSLFMIKTMFS